MNLFVKVGAAVGAAFLMLAAPAAQAGGYNISFVDTSSTYTVNAFISTSDVLNGVGGYDITGVTGTVGGFSGTEAISGLILNPSQPNGTNCCGFNYDNVFYSPAAPFDLQGVLFSTSNRAYNLYMDGSTARLGAYLMQPPTAASLVDVAGRLTVSVPEPGTWAMLLLGFAAVGALVRRRRVLVAS